MSHRLVVIDQATATELAEVGGVTVRRAKPCRTCEHVHVSLGYLYCAARANTPCEYVNPDSQCELWEGKQALVSSPPMTPLTMWTVVVALLSFVLGAVLL
jgi:hypothetical protein